jgi:hypothetical protein
VYVVLLSPAVQTLTNVRFERIRLRPEIMEDTTLMQTLQLLPSTQSMSLINGNLICIVNKIDILIDSGFIGLQRTKNNKQIWTRTPNI